jgi:Cdc6-like AAA superfamily ATPase
LCLLVNENVEEIKTNVAEMRRKQGEAEECAILDWISPGDAHANQQSDYFKRHQEGTGQWLLNSEEYRAWLTGRGETLFRWGMPGAGKTVLTSIVVNHLLRQQQPSVGVAYVYCNFQRQDSQKVEDLLSVLLKQLTLGLSSLPETVRELYETHTTKTRTPPSAEGILQCLKSVIASSKRERTFIVVDALDECLGPDGDPSDLMVELFRLQDICPVNLFVTSRPIPDIMRKFSPGVSAEIKAHETDVVQYLNGHMSRLPRFVMDTPGLVDAIKQEIMVAVRGMYVHACITNRDSTPFQR